MDVVFNHLQVDTHNKTFAVQNNDDEEKDPYNLYHVVLILLNDWSNVLCVVSSRFRQTG